MADVDKLVPLNGYGSGFDLRCRLIDGGWHWELLEADSGCTIARSLSGVMAPKYPPPASLEDCIFHAGITLANRHR